MTGNLDSSSGELAPFLIEPRFVARVWGYLDLHPWYDYAVGPQNGTAGSGDDGQPIGEVWLTGDECRVGSGPYAGTTLGQMFADHPAALLGASSKSPQSPLLIKLIFAREKLSVQVHPDDRMAQKYGEPRGKTECWFALAAEPGAKVAAGLKSGMTMDAVRAGIEDGTLEQSLNLIPVAAGDMVFIDAGTVHAIWPGSILLETQQNSDTTYRLYDYGRPRPLHIEKSIEAMRLHTSAGIVPPRTLEDRTILIDVDYFRVERIAVSGERSSASLPDAGEAPAALSYLFAAAGSARLAGDGFDPVQLPPRGIVAIPAASPAFVLQDIGGLDLIRISPRWPGNAQ